MSLFFLLNCSNGILKGQAQGFLLPLKFIIVIIHPDINFYYNQAVSDLAIPPWEPM